MCEFFFSLASEFVFCGRVADPFFFISVDIIRWILSLDSWLSLLG